LRAYFIKNVICTDKNMIHLKNDCAIRKLLEKLNIPYTLSGKRTLIVDTYYKGVMELHLNKTEIFVKEVIDKIENQHIFGICLK